MEPSRLYSDVPGTILYRARLLVPLLAFLVYWPALDNGFISDDYVFLERVQDWSSDPLYLFQIPPECFRTTTYLVFLTLKGLFGHQSGIFYLFTILLHSLNALLLGRLLKALTGDRRVAFWTSVLFVTFQNPQEAIMWLGGMHENLLGFFLLLTLICWVEERYTWCGIFYCCALLSKESAAIVFALLPLLDLWRGKRPFLRLSYLPIIIPSIVFGLLFLSLAGQNSLLAGGFYALSPQAIPVMLNSLHRLSFPWLYVLVAATLMRRVLILRKETLIPFAWIFVGLLPYVFLTYQDHVPSRHEYLASMGAMMMSAYLLRVINRQRFTVLFLVIFIVVNSGYIALRKDAQFESRAAPTSGLIAVLRQSTPEPILVTDFPLNPWIGRLTARLVPGWDPGMIRIEGSGDRCPGCPVLRWAADEQTYLISQ